jgi:hypothetical protein
MNFGYVFMSMIFASCGLAERTYEEAFLCQ